MGILQESDGNLIVISWQSHELQGLCSFCLFMYITLTFQVHTLTLQLMLESFYFTKLKLSTRIPGKWKSWESFVKEIWQYFFNVIIKKYCPMGVLNAFIHYKVCQHVMLLLCFCTDHCWHWLLLCSLLLTHFRDTHTHALKRMMNLLMMLRNPSELTEDPCLRTPLTPPPFYG